MAGLVRVFTLDMQQDVSLDRLESHLWEAANILRGTVDAADFKTYVFPLLFFKRISDVHDEEYAAFPQNYRFQIPERCHWRDVRAAASNASPISARKVRASLESLLANDK